jgi:hypothetical protein
MPLNFPALRSKPPKHQFQRKKIGNKTKKERNLE